MNRIILIGNGFDLAHGLKTSYKDFIDWYFGEWGDRLRMSHNRVEEDSLCSFRLNNNHYDWFNIFNIYGIISPLEHRDGIEIAKIAKNKPELCSFTIKSPLFRELYRSYETKGWVDIENEYYKYLCRAGMTHDAAKAANDDLDYIKKKLIEYLSDINKNIIDEMIKNEIMEKMKEPFHQQDIAVSSIAQFPYIKEMFRINKMSEKPVFPETYFLLNFNYTTLADLYFSFGDSTIPFDRRSTTHIHGELSKQSSVIFGYGDELDQGYRLLLKKNDNEYLRNIKSIKYLEFANYRHLLEFIESSPYQIYIMGHSCGNSDKTLLNTLFEHRNCVSIKPYYHKLEDGTDNYLELAQNISRNFTDMKLMRDRVVNKEFCESLM